MLSILSGMDSFSETGLAPEPEGFGGPAMGPHWPTPTTSSGLSRVGALVDPQGQHVWIFGACALTALAIGVAMGHIGGNAQEGTHLGPLHEEAELGLGEKGKK